jgi:hypothetical protein
MGFKLINDTGSFCGAIRVFGGLVHGFSPTKELKKEKALRVAAQGPVAHRGV